MPMLTSFSVTGYRCFKDRTTLSLVTPHDYRFGSENVRGNVITNALLLGRNASGKTNFGRALGNLCDNFRTGAPNGLPADDATFLNADTDRPLAEFEYVFSFSGDEVRYAYEKDASQSLISETLTVNDELAFAYDNVGSRLTDGNLALVGAESLNRAYADEYVSFISYLVNSVPQRESAVIHAMREFVSGMHMLTADGRGHAARRSVIRRIIDSNRVSDLEAFLNRFGVDEHLVVRTEPDGTRSLFFDHRRPVSFADACSSGTETLLMIFFWYEMRENAFYFIDEFDAYCHYEMAESLVRYFGESDSCQTICATHNTSLIRNGLMRPDCVFLVDRTGIRSLADRTDREIRLGNNTEKLLRGGEFD